VLYVLGGPLIWLANLLLLALADARGCVPDAAVVGIQSGAAAGCIALLYRALSGVRDPASAGNEHLRLTHFIAGGVTVLSMVAIGMTALPSALMAACG